MIHNEALIHAKSVSTKQLVWFCVYFSILFQGKLDFLIFHIHFILLLRGDGARVEYKCIKYSTYFIHWLELDDLCGPFQPKTFDDPMILWWL